MKNDVKNARKHLYGRNAEQQRLLSNRDTNTLGQDKADYYGTTESVKHEDETQVKAPQQKNPRKKEDKKRAPKKSCKGGQNHSPQCGGLLSSA